MLAYWEHRLARAQIYPFLRYQHRFAEQGIQFRAVPASTLGETELVECADAVFLQSSYTSPIGDLEALLDRLKSVSPELQITYLDWFAPTDLRMAERVFPWVSHYVKKSVLRDRLKYKLPTVGHTTLTDHYTARFGAENPPRTWELPQGIIDKLEVGPAFSTTPGMIEMFERENPPEHDRPLDLHARIATRGSTWYTAMREEAQRSLGCFPDLRVVSEGRVSQSEFLRELGGAKLCFSPFGYGEICWRDFEAIAMGSVLIKPDMSHIEAEPDIYRANQTYIPVRWDFADLEHRVRELLAEPERMAMIAKNAFAVVRDHLRGPSLMQLVGRLSA